MGTATGEDRCMAAVQQAIQSPLLETTIDGAAGMIINFSGDVSFLVNDKLYMSDYGISNMDDLKEFYLRGSYFK